MAKMNYKCRNCGEIVEDNERAMHVSKHYPNLSQKSINDFARKGFILTLEAPTKPTTKTIKKSSKGNVQTSSPKKMPPQVISKGRKNANKGFSPKAFLEANNKDVSQKVSVPRQDGKLNYKPVNVPYSPKSGQPNDLFEYAVKRVAKRYQNEPDLLEPKTHKEWINICFDPRNIPNLMREEYMSRIKSTYTEYFKRGAGRKYTFDFEKIANVYPYFFEFGKNDAPSSKNQGIDGMIAAVKNEIYLASFNTKKDKYKVYGIEPMDLDKNLYALFIEIDDSKTLSFNESMKADLKINESWYKCEFIDYDDDECVIYVSSNRQIHGHEGMLYIDMTFILKMILEHLEKVKGFGLTPIQPANKFLKECSSDISTIASSILDSYPNIIGKMDDSQQKAVDATIMHDISFIWGPPGTGKSFTLAGLINILCQREETTLVCCVSNVAVDQLLNKVIDKIDEVSYTPFNCEFMRAGYTTDSHLLATDYLFPKDSISDKLRKRIRKINDDLASLPKIHLSKVAKQRKLKLKEERIELKEELRKHTEYIVDKSRIVFSTMAYYVLSAQLEKKEFDNLIVDEASMLSMPYLIALARNVFKRIILVGDPNQLGPISINPEGMLSKSVFDHCKVLDDINPHRALSRLLVQRRSHRFIVNLTNDLFYDGKLRAVVEKSPQWVLEEPFPKKIIKVINSDIEKDGVNYLGTSRCNFGTLNRVMEILDECHYAYLNNKTRLSIGVITPYRAQVGKYKEKIRERFNDDGFWESIKVGTVHTFQGSECDMIIFDIVEKYPEAVSKIFNYKEGERLVNVALSRARHKLIIVGDTLRFRGGAGLARISNKTSKVLGRLKDITTNE